MEEFEITFLEVDVPDLEKKLASIGAQKIGEYNYSRALFDYPDFRMNNRHAWLRLRTDGKETSLTYKERIGVQSRDGSISDEGMKEIEVEVSNFEGTYKILQSVGFVVKREEQNRRIRYKKGNTYFDIDSWPMIPTYLEVESRSIAEARESAKELGLDPNAGLIFSPKQAYAKYGYDMDDYSSITFEKFVKK